MNLLIITKPERYKEWQALFGLKGHHLHREGVTISSVEQGSQHWEAFKWSLVIVEEDVVLDETQKSCLNCLAMSIAIAMKPSDVLGVHPFYPPTPYNPTLDWKVGT